MQVTTRQQARKHDKHRSFFWDIPAYLLEAEKENIHI